jgi:hypothetical protein
MTTEQCGDSAWNPWWRSRQLQCKFLDLYCRWYEQRRKNISKKCLTDGAPEFAIDLNQGDAEKTQNGVFVWKSYVFVEERCIPIAPFVWVDGLIIQQYDTEDETGGPLLLNPSPDQNRYGDRLSQLRGLILKNYNKEDLTDSFFQQVPNLKWLDLHGAYNAVQPSALTFRLFQNLSKLESLSINHFDEMFDVKQEDITAMTEVFRQLKSLRDLRIETINDYSLCDILFPNLSQLETLRISDFNELDWYLVHLPYLQTLDVQYGTITNWDPTKTLYEQQPCLEEKTTTVWNYVTGLRKLILRGGILTYDMFDFSPLQNLEYFECYKDSDVGQPELRSLATLPKLRVMKIDSRILAGKDNSEESCFQGLTQLKELHLYNLSAEQRPKSWIETLRPLQNLECLVAEEQFAHVSDFWDELHHGDDNVLLSFLNFRRLRIKLSRERLGYSRKNYESVLAVVRNLRQIQSISVDKCPDFSNADLLPLQNLKYFSIQSPCYVEKDVVKDLPHLEYGEVYGGGGPHVFRYPPMAPEKRDLPPEHRYCTPRTRVLY